MLLAVFWLDVVFILVLFIVIVLFVLSIVTLSFEDVSSYSLLAFFVSDIVSSPFISLYPTCIAVLLNFIVSVSPFNADTVVSPFSSVVFFAVAVVVIEFLTLSCVILYFTPCITSLVSPSFSTIFIV